MSYFDTPFTPDEKQAQQTFEPIPERNYVLVITKCQEKTSKNNDPMLSLTYEVDSNDADYGGRKLFGIIMLGHSNPDVVASGKRQLHALALMCGLKQITGPSDFEGCTITARVKIKTDKTSGEKRNEVVLAAPKANAATAVVEPKKSGESSLW